MTSSPPAERTTSVLSSVATLTWRLFLLILGGGIAFGGGLLWAIQSPQAVTQKPFVVEFWQYWQTQLDSSSAASTTAATPSAEDLKNQIQQLQAQAEQPGANSEMIQAQLNTLQKQLAQATSLRDFALPTHELKVTLPSDFLFLPTDSTLSPAAKTVLDEFLIQDLQSHEGKTILIAAHTDVEDNPQLNRELSFRRAKALESYLSQALEGDYRWVATGYGKDPSQDNATSLLNRRIEIAVD